MSVGIQAQNQCTFNSLCSRCLNGDGLFHSFYLRLRFSMFFKIKYVTVSTPSSTGHLPKFHSLTCLKNLVPLNEISAIKSGRLMSE